MTKILVNTVVLVLWCIFVIVIFAALAGCARYVVELPDGTKADILTSRRISNLSIEHSQGATTVRMEKVDAIDIPVSITELSRIAAP